MTETALIRPLIRGNVMPENPKIAVLIPCLNEELMVGTVVADFRRELPEAEIWVVDNGSTDNTTAVAAAAGACILREPRRGNGAFDERAQRWPQRRTRSWSRPR